MSLPDGYDTWVGERGITLPIEDHVTLAAGTRGTRYLLIRAVIPDDLASGLYKSTIIMIAVLVAILAGIVGLAFLHVLAAAIVLVVLSLLILTYWVWTYGPSSPSAAAFVIPIALALLYFCVAVALWERRIRARRRVHSLSTGSPGSSRVGGRAVKLSRRARYCSMWGGLRAAVDRARRPDASRR